MTLNVNYEELLSLSSSIISRGDEFLELLTEIKGHNARLQEAWAGTDSVAYADKVAVQAEQMQRLSETINEIGLFLQRVSDAYRETQNNIASAARNS